MAQAKKGWRMNKELFKVSRRGEEVKTVDRVVDTLTAMSTKTGKTNNQILITTNKRVILADLE